MTVLPMQALDKVIADAANSNIRLVIGLADAGSNLGYGGPDMPLQFMQWVTGSYNVTGGPHAKACLSYHCQLCNKMCGLFCVTLYIEQLNKGLTQ